MNNIEPVKIELLLTLDNNIICQRFFNVKNFNIKAKSSLELYDYMKYMCEIISNDLKTKNADYMLENKKTFEASDYVEETSNKDSLGFLLQLKMGEKVFNERIFPSHIYHPKVRLDVRPHLRGFLNDLTYILSLKKVETKYLNYQL